MTTLFRAFGWLILLAGLAPLLMAVWVSFSPDSFLTPPVEAWSLKWYRRFADDSRWTAAAGRSLVVAVLSSGACVGLALLAVVSNRTGNRLLLPPAVLPPVAIGLGLLPALQRVGLWGTLGSVIVVHTAMGLPVAYLLLRSWAGERLAELELAARGLGANRWAVFLRVTLPVLRPAILAAVVVQFVLSWNEALVTVFLTTSKSETLPVVMWSQLRGSASPLVAVAAVVSATAGLVAVAVIARAFRRRG